MKTLSTKNMSTKTTTNYKAITVSLVSLKDGTLRATGRIEGRDVAEFNGTSGRLLVSAALAEVASGHVVNGKYDWNYIGLNNLAALAISSK